MFTFATSTQNITGSPSKMTRQEKETKKLSKLKGGSVPVCRWHDLISRNTWRLQKSVLEMINWFQ
jgi:hypothetical protein